MNAPIKKSPNKKSSKKAELKAKAKKDQAMNEENLEPKIRKYQVYLNSFFIFQII
jgi:hypothetical protein